MVDILRRLLEPPPDLDGPQGEVGRAIAAALRGDGPDRGIRIASTARPNVGAKDCAVARG